VSEQLGISNIVHYVSIQEAQESLFKFCEIYDEPFGDTSGIPTYILSKLAREHVKAALSADGGDEQFCGYESYSSYSSNFSLMERIPRFLRKFLLHALEDCFPYRHIISWKLRFSKDISYFPQTLARYEKMLRLLENERKLKLIQLMNEKGWSLEEIDTYLPVLKEEVFRERFSIRITSRIIEAVSWTR
jgi:asparagine synthetase B (glutamine-hydrolysing)